MTAIVVMAVGGVIAVSVVAELIAVRRLGHDLEATWAEKAQSKRRPEGVRDLPAADSDIA